MNWNLPVSTISAAILVTCMQDGCSAASWPTTDYTGCVAGPPAAPGTVAACESEAEVQKVIDEHRDALTACWRHSRLPQANVCVRFTIGPDGTVLPGDLSSDAPVVASCVGDEMRGWRFPAHGCPQKVQLLLHLVRPGSTRP
jgi:hypothetical protein